MFNPEELAYREPERTRFRVPQIRKPSLPSKKVRFILGGILLFVCLMVGGWLSYQNLQKQFQPKSTQDAKNDTPPTQVMRLIESVESNGTNLPDNEFPSVATISDLSKLSDQAFFNGAEIGDKVLIYAGAKRAILFRPSTNTIVRESRVEIADNPEAAPTASSSAILGASDSAEPVLRIKF